MKNKISKSKKNKQRLQQRRRDWKHRGLTSQVENRCVDVFVCVCVCVYIYRNSDGSGTTHISPAASEVVLIQPL